MWESPAHAPARHLSKYLTSESGREVSLVHREQIRGPRLGCKRLRECECSGGTRSLGEEGQDQIYVCGGVHREGETPGWTGMLSERAGQRGAMAVGEEGQ